MILRKSYHTSYKQGNVTFHQELEVRTNKEVYSREGVEDLCYDDFDVYQYKNGESFGKATELLKETKLFELLVDQVDWEEIYCDAIAERN